MATENLLTGLRAETRRRVPDPPGVDEIVEDAGRARLAAYYLYSALLAGVIDDDGLTPARWPPELAEPMQRLGLSRFAPRTGRGLDAQLTLAEQATRRSPGTQLEFAQLLVDLVNQGTFGSLPGGARRVRLAGRGDGRGPDVELIRGLRVTGTCRAADFWEPVAQHLAGAPSGGLQAERGSARRPEPTGTRRLKDSAVAHAVSLGATLALHVEPLGAVAGYGTRLVRSRIRAGRDEADAFHRLGQDLRTLRAQAEGELGKLRAGRGR
jgi:hypothetical protein